MLTIDLYTEISCPWCIIAHHRLDKVLRTRFPHVRADIRQHPVLLTATTPDAGIFIPDLLRSKYGITDPAQALARPQAEADASGIAVDFGRQQWSFRTQPAHGLILAARERGTQHALAVAISDAYFIEAARISEPSVLADIALNHGFGWDEALQIAADPAQHALVEGEAARSAAAGIRSVPHMVLNEKLALSGGRSEDEIAAAIDRSLSDA